MNTYNSHFNIYFHLKFLFLISHIYSNIFRSCWQEFVELEFYCHDFEVNNNLTVIIIIFFIFYIVINNIFVDVFSLIKYACNQSIVCKVGGVFLISFWMLITRKILKKFHDVQYHDKSQPTFLVFSRLRTIIALFVLFWKHLYKLKIIN